MSVRSCYECSSSKKQEYPQEESILRTWFIDGRKVSLIENEKTFKCNVIDLLKNSEFSCPLEVEGLTVKELKSYILKCIPIINKFGHVDFSNHIKHWDITNKKMVFLTPTTDKTLVWQVFEKCKGRVYQFLCNEHEEKSLTDRISCLINLSASQMPQDVLKRIATISTWTIGQIEVCLLQEGEKLEYEITDKSRQNVIRNPLEIPGLTTDELVHYLAKCVPVLNWLDCLDLITNTRDYPVLTRDYFVDFARPKIIWKVTGERKIRLLETPDQALIWELFENATQRSYQFPCTQYGSKSMQDRISLLTNLHVEEMPSEVLKLISIKSRVNPETTIDGNQCGFTLVSTGDDWHGHAVVVIEGLENGFPFLWFAHLTGSGTKKEGTSEGKTHLTKNPPKEYQIYKSKTQTWIRAKEKIQKIIELLEWEIKQQQKGETWNFFNILGADSIAVKPVFVKEFKDINEFEDYAQQEAIPWRESSIDNTFNWFKGGANRVYIGKSKTMCIDSFISEKEPRMNNLSSGVKLLIKPDNCITYARRILTLADIFLEFNNSRGIVTTPMEYTDSRTKKGQERLIIPCIVGSYHYECDLTEEVQRQVQQKLGKCSWRLTTESQQIVQHMWENLQGALGLILPAFQESLFNGEGKLEFSVDVEGQELVIDISSELKRQYEMFKHRQQSERSFLGQLKQECSEMWEIENARAKAVSDKICRIQ